MRILIAGGGKVGSTLARLLTAEDHEVTLIDRSASVLEEIMGQYDVMAVQGNAASMDVLEQAGVKEADLLIAATDMDETNLLTCLTAHGINEKIHTIGRIRNPEYRRQAFEMRSVFALNMVINPEQEAAAAISRLLKYPGFLTIESFAKGNVDIAELRVTADSKLNNLTLSSLPKVAHCQVLVCAVLRDGKCLMPNGNFVLKENDKIYVASTTDNLSTLLISLGYLSRMIRNVMITGGGRISYYLAKYLQAGGMKCEIVEVNHRKCVELAALLPEARIVEGDASNQNLMESERISQYDALVTLTGLDELNLIMSMYGNAQGIDHVITKLSHAENNKLLDALNLGSVISPKELVSDKIVQYVRAMGNRQGAAVSIHRIADGQAEAIEFRIDKNTKNIGVKFKDLKVKPNILIASVTNSQKTEIASGNSHFELDDTVVVVTDTQKTIFQMNDIFEAG